MINKAILVGRLGKDPEVRYATSGTAVCNFSIATSEKYKDKEGESQEKTEWHNITAWGRLGEVCGEYLSKGSLVYVEGAIETQSWEKDGEKKYKTIINIRNMQMLGDKKNGSSSESGGTPEDSDWGDDDSDLPF